VLDVMGREGVHELRPGNPRVRLLAKRRHQRRQPRAAADRCVVVQEPDVGPRHDLQALVAGRAGADIALVSLDNKDFNGVENAAFGERQPFVIQGPGEYEVKGVVVRTEAEGASEADLERAASLLKDAARGKQAIGTTQKGIGPVYEAKAGRIGLRLWDIISPEIFKERLATAVPAANRLLTDLFGAAPVNEADIFETYSGYARALAPFVCDTTAFINEALAHNRTILCEGNQGFLLDVDCGSYPFVTASRTVSGGAVTGTGIPPYALKTIVGVVKAFQTRVGAGPMPTELPDGEGELGDKLRNSGPAKEFGATTGRPRRCGWLDLPLLRYAIRTGGVTALAITKLDALGVLDEIQVCMSYETAAGVMETFNGNANLFAEAKPQYQTLPGWKSDISAIRDFDALPAAAKNYLDFIEKQTGVPVALIGVGPNRAEIIVRKAVF